MESPENQEHYKLPGLREQDQRNGKLGSVDLKINQVYSDLRALKVDFTLPWVGSRITRSILSIWE
jgi:hypothetical protein